MARKNETRKNVPAAGLGPVDRMGDRARLTERALASAKAKSLKAAKAAPASEAAAKPSRPSRKPAYVRAQADFARMPAPAAGGTQIRRGSSFTAGSKADMAYTGVKSPTAPTAAPKAARAVRKVPRMGTGVGGAIATAAGAAGLAIHDKMRSRKRKPAK